MRRSQIFTIVGVMGLVAFVAGEGRALAQTGNQTTVEHIQFVDDQLLLTVTPPGQATVMARGGVVRTILVRPRTTFVPELFKSIEKL